MYIIICVWIMVSIFTGINITCNDLEYNFLKEIKWIIEKLKLNIFGKVIIYLFFLPYLTLYLIAYIIIKTLTWHPNSKS